MSVNLPELFNNRSLVIAGINIMARLIPDDDPKLPQMDEMLNSIGIMDVPGKIEKGPTLYSRAAYVRLIIEGECDHEKIQKISGILRASPLHRNATFGFHEENGERKLCITVLLSDQKGLLDRSPSAFEHDPLLISSDPHA